MSEPRMRRVVWQSVETAGMDYLRLWLTLEGSDDDEIEVEGRLVALANGKPVSMTYNVITDPDARIYEVDITDHDDPWVPLLFSDGDAKWYDQMGEPYPQFEGCSTIDLSASPFSNTLALRHLKLSAGESREIRVIYIDGNAHTVEAVMQRYTYLEPTADGGRYRFEHLPNGYTAEITVDGDLLVIDYPGLFTRVFAD